VIPESIRTDMDFDHPALLFVRDGKVWLLKAERAKGALEEIVYRPEQREEPMFVKQIPLFTQSIRLQFRLEMMLPAVMELLENEELQKQLLAVLRPEPTKVKPKRRATGTTGRKR